MERLWNKYVAVALFYIVSLIILRKSGRRSLVAFVCGVVGNPSNEFQIRTFKNISFSHFPLVTSSSSSGFPGNKIAWLLQLK